MIVFILGKTKTGKSTLAEQIQSISPFHLYEAGAWARQGFEALYPGPHDEFSTAFKDRLTRFAMDSLAQDPLCSVSRYRLWRQDHPGDIIISGVRNPDDFFHLTSLESGGPIKIIFTFSSPSFISGDTLAFFEEGLSIIRSYVEWKNRIPRQDLFFPLLDLDDATLSDPQQTLSLLKEFL